MGLDPWASPRFPIPPNRPHVQHFSHRTWIKLVIFWRNWAWVNKSNHEKVQLKTPWNMGFNGISWGLMVFNHSFGRFCKRSLNLADVKSDTTTPRRYVVFDGRRPQKRAENRRKIARLLMDIVCTAHPIDVCLIGFYQFPTRFRDHLNCCIPCQMFPFDPIICRKSRPIILCQCQPGINKPWFLIVGVPSK